MHQLVGDETHDVIFASRRQDVAAKIMSYDYSDVIFSPYGSVINLSDEVNSLMYCITSSAAFGNKCKDQELFVEDVFTAGSDASATIVDWAMSEMMKNPTIIKKAQAEVREIFSRRKDDLHIIPIPYHWSPTVE
ncbi:hypothetical protein KPL71_002023 [Citrus sinensis]|uniref:Uncharacterized protein n=1 Tax=Citrus sinensis TaxID=2711 RepID=A0ACB8P2X6_CITSI|nr:hypothetical protein KPL71_002023 [Citrus sinensis]